MASLFNIQAMQKQVQQAIALQKAAVEAAAGRPAPPSISSAVMAPSVPTMTLAPPRPPPAGEPTPSVGAPSVPTWTTPDFGAQLSIPAGGGIAGGVTPGAPTPSLAWYIALAVGCYVIFLLLLRRR